MESGAKGCEVVVSGKLRGQRAKSMKFVDGLMITVVNQQMIMLIVQLGMCCLDKVSVNFDCLFIVD